jgi:hypothetical protein
VTNKKLRMLARVPAAAVTAQESKFQAMGEPARERTARRTHRESARAPWEA